jgi:hypothetical protein
MRCGVYWGLTTTQGGRPCTSPSPSPYSRGIACKTVRAWVRSNNFSPRSPTPNSWKGCGSATRGHVGQAAFGADPESVVATARCVIGRNVAVLMASTRMLCADSILTRPCGLIFVAASCQSPPIGGSHAWSNACRTTLTHDNANGSSSVRMARRTATRSEGDRSMFSANGSLVKCGFSPKNGPVPGHCSSPVRMADPAGASASLL